MPPTKASRRLPPRLSWPVEIAVGAVTATGVGAPAGAATDRAIVGVAAGDCVGCGPAAGAAGPQAASMVPMPPTTSARNAALRVRELPRSWLSIGDSPQNHAASHWL